MCIDRFLKSYEMPGLAVGSPVVLEKYEYLFFFIMYWYERSTVMFCSETLSCLQLIPRHEYLLSSSVVCTKCRGSNAKCQVPARRSWVGGRSTRLSGLADRAWEPRIQKQFPSTQRQHPFDIFENPLPIFGALWARGRSLSSVDTESPTHCCTTGS